MKKLLLILLCLPMIGFGQEKNFNIFKDISGPQTKYLHNHNNSSQSTMWILNNFFNVSNYQISKHSLTISSVIKDQIDSLKIKSDIFSNEYNKYYSNIHLKCNLFSNTKDSILNRINELKTTTEYINYLNTEKLILGKEGVVLDDKKLIKKLLKKLKKYDIQDTDLKVIINEDQDIKIISIERKDKECLFSEIVIKSQKKEYNKILKILIKNSIAFNKISETDIFKIIDSNTILKIQKNLINLASYNKNLKYKKDKYLEDIIDQLIRFRTSRSKKFTSNTGGKLDSIAGSTPFYPEIITFNGTTSYLDSLQFLLNEFYSTDTLSLGYYYRYYNRYCFPKIEDVLYARDDYNNSMNSYIEDSLRYSTRKKQPILTKKLKKRCEGYLEEKIQSESGYIFKDVIIESYENFEYPELKDKYPCLRTVICHFKCKDDYDNIVRYAVVIAFRLTYPNGTLMFEDFVLINKSEKGTIAVKMTYFACESMTWHTADSPKDSYIGMVFDCVFNDHMFGKEEYASKICESVSIPDITEYTKNSFLYLDNQGLELFRNTIIEEDDDEEFFMVAENMPEFPGGDLGLVKYIQANVKYPAAAKEYNITGKVFVSFIVDKFGSVTNVRIARGIDKNLDAEALRVVKSLPKYKAGRNRGVRVKVKLTIPINFDLEMDNY